MDCAEAHDASTVDAFYGVKKSEAFAIDRSGKVWAAELHSIDGQATLSSAAHLMDRAGPHEKVVNGFLAEGILK